MKKRMIWAVAAMVLTAALVLYAQMQPPAGGPGPGQRGPGMRHHGPLGQMAQMLQLTDEQRTQIKSLWQAEKPVIDPLLQQLANGHKEMVSATASGAFDEARVRSIASQQSQVIAQLLVEKEKLQSKIYNQVLTPEQRTKADTMRQQNAAGMDRWLQHMAGSPGM